MVTTKQAGGRAGGAFRGGPGGGRSPPAKPQCEQRYAMWATTCNPANHHRSSCIRPGFAAPLQP
eukprot:4205448-Alexandrium_andersonii.AAC.1